MIYVLILKDELLNFVKYLNDQVFKVRWVVSGYIMVKTPGEIPCI